jgi:4'-phosphopantetheinyl transferase
MVRPGDVRSNDQIAACRSLLTPEEREREERFHFAEDRHLYLLTRSLERTILSGYVGLPPERLVFERTEKGKPWLANAQHECRQISFNISHTRGLLLLAVSSSRPLGIDVEGLNRADFLGIANQFFAPSELTALQALTAEQRHERFFEYWTLKEAYIKARSAGFFMPLDRFAFGFDAAHSITFTAAADLDDQPDRWSFLQFQPTPAFVAAICADIAPEAPREAVLRRVTPLLEVVGEARVIPFSEPPSPISPEAAFR